MSEFNGHPKIDGIWAAPAPAWSNNELSASISYMVSQQKKEKADKNFHNKVVIITRIIIEFLTNTSDPYEV